MKKKLILGTIALGAFALFVAAEEAVPDGHHHDGAEADAVHSMSSRQAPSSAHMTMTALRPSNEDDRRRADEIVQQLAIVRSGRQERIVNNHASP